MISDEIYERLTSAVAPEYELGREIGRGGMGLVFRARDTRLHRDVAIKLLPPDLAANEDLRERFSFEAQLAAGLNHPHIVPIFDVDERDDLVWYVMAMIEGESLKARVQRVGPLNSSQTARIIREVAWALAYAHARGIVHRDIKPDNILLDDATGRAMVTDFGIAKMMDDPAAFAEDEGQIVGSLMYMAPEQATGEGDVDARADIYALGLSGFYLLSGAAPFQKASILTVAARVATGLRPDWESIEPTVDPPLQSLLDQCCEPNPDDRWDDAEQILDALGPQALAARPMPASIRRLVRDFLLIPTLAFIVLIVGVISEDAGLTEFIAWMAMILAVNFGVTLRAFSRRGYSWADLRDGLEMELGRQSEELAATGDLKARVKAVVYLATTAGLTIQAVDLAVVLDKPVLLFALLAVPVAFPIAWLQFRVLSFFGRLGRKLIPSLPTPESEGWFPRLADAGLARLFKPVKSGDVDEETAETGATSTGWRHTDLGSARRSTHDIDELFSELPAEMRKEVRPARRVARELTGLIDRLRKERTDVEREREHEMENLGGSARQAGVVLERLRVAIEDYADGRIDGGRFRAALGHGTDLLESVEAGSSVVQPVSRPSVRSRKWLGMQLDSTVEGRVRIDDAPSGIHELGSEVLEGIRHSRQMGRDVPGAPEITEFVNGARMLAAEIFLGVQRGAHTDPIASESLDESESILERLVVAIEAHRDGRSRELELLADQVSGLSRRIGAILESLS